MKLSILHKGLLIVSIPLLFEVFFVIVLVNQIDQTSEHIKIEKRSQDIIISVETILKEIADSTTSAIIYNVSRRPDLLTRHRKSREKINKHIARLKRLTKSDPEESAAASRMASSARHWGKRQDEAIEADPRFRLGAFFFMPRNSEVSNLLVMRSEGAGKTIIEKENRIQSIQPKLLKQSIFRIQVLLVFGAIVNITITVFLAIYFAKYISQRLNNVLTNTFKLGARMELNPPMRGDDEIAVLDKALHDSAKEIIEFETFKEQLIGVVSHELRTPLTSIQGTLTLLQAGAMGDYPDPMMKSVESTQEHLTKLINLVNDLLLIERLESGSQVIKQEDIDLKALVEASYQETQKELALANPSVVVSGQECSTIGDTQLLTRAFSIVLSISQERLMGERETLVVVDETVDGISIIFQDNAQMIQEDELEQFFTRDKLEKLEEEEEEEDSDEKKSQGANILSKSLCKAIVTAHGGRITIDSSQESTSITILLPYRRKSDD